MHYDMEDLLEQANEIQESLGRAYAVPDEIDEEDLQAELEALELEVEEEGPSYLNDLGKVPDYLDEEPVENTAEVSNPFISHLWEAGHLRHLLDTGPTSGGAEEHRLRVTMILPYPFLSLSSFSVLVSDRIHLTRF